MNRSAWVTLALAALIGLRAPLCVFSCSSTGSTSIAASTDESGEASAPCHGAEEPKSDPAPSSDCGCDRIQLALASNEGSASFGSSVEFSPTLVVAVDDASSVRGEPTRQRRTLRPPPPPDLLLLKSTLLI